MGVAFGLVKDEQRIGQVLVSSQLADYDLTKLNRRSVIPRGDKVTASTTLLSALQSTDATNRGRRDRWPKVSFGLVLTGQKLVNSFAHVQFLKRMYPEALGGEMEGLGLYVAAAAAKTDWVVVKGICDWGYNKNNAKKEAWQRLASKNAALVLKAALDAGPLHDSI